MLRRVAFLLLMMALPATGKLRGEGCRLFLLGDSIMVQYAPALKSSLPGDWTIDGKTDNAGAPPAVHNLDVPTGANGGDSGMVLAYLQARAAHQPIQADLLLLNCGLHDLKCDLKTGTRQVAISDYRKNLRAIIALLKPLQVALVWVRITPVIDAVHNTPTLKFSRHAVDVAAYNAAADEIMRECGVPEIDLGGFTAPFVPEAFVDHVHYNVATQEKQAAFVAGSLRAIWELSLVHRQQPLRGPATPSASAN